MVMELPHHQEATPWAAQAKVSVSQAPVVVGCALLPKKVQRYLTARMLSTAADNNIVLKPIDRAKPLEPQGPFDVIIHKLRPNPGWEQQLRQYVLDHPEVVVVDSIDKIRQLHNRSTMLRPLQGEGIVLQQPQHTVQPQHTQQAVLVQAPLQVEIPEGMTEAEAQAALAAAGLAPPLLCKPLWTDGRDGSHQLAVLHDLEALGRLLRGAVCSEFKPPLVVQQFVEHGGVLFKVYVLGSQTYVTARPSLGETVLQPDHAVQQLPRISCVSVFSKQQQHQGRMQQPQPRGTAGTGATAAGSPPAALQAAVCEQGTAALHSSRETAPEQQPQQLRQGSPSSCTHKQQPQQKQQPSAALAAVAAESVWRPPSSIVAPPAWLTSALAATLRQELGMQLFNFDLIVPEQQPGACVSQQGQHQQQQPGGAASDPDAAPPLCFVVDINFFPGVDKIPDFERRFVTFLLDAAAGGAASAAAAAAKQAQQAGPAAAAPRQAVAADVSVQAPGSGHGDRGRQSSTAVGGSHGLARRSSSSSGGGGCGASCGGSSRRLQHSLSAGADRTLGAGAAAGAVGSGAASGRRLSGTGGSSGGSRHGSGLDAAAPQWGDRGVLGSSPPAQLQVAGCS